MVERCLEKNLPMWDTVTGKNTKSPTSVSQCQWDVFVVCRHPFPSDSIPGSRRPPLGAFQNKRPGGPGSQIPARSRHELDHSTGDTRMSSLTGKKEKRSKQGWEQREHFHFFVKLFFFFFVKMCTTQQQWIPSTATNNCGLLPPVAML